MKDGKIQTLQDHAEQLPQEIGNCKRKITLHQAANNQHNFLSSTLLISIFPPTKWQDCLFDLLQSRKGIASVADICEHCRKRHAITASHHLEITESFTA